MLIPLRNFKRFFYKALKQPGYALYVLIKRLKVNFYRSFSGGKSGKAEAITLFLTHRCNLHCQMCGQWGERGVTKIQGQEYLRQELSFAELSAVMDEVSAFRPSITLFGGEPFLHRDCLRLIRYIKQRKMHCLVITNGSLIESIAEEIVDSGLDELNLSLDGKQGLHDQIRRMPGLFEKITCGLKKVNHFKAQKNRRKPLINLQCTINHQNYKYLEQMTEVAAEIKADSLTFHNLIFLEPEILDKQREYDTLLNCSSAEWKGFVFEPAIDPDVLYEKMKMIMSGKYSFAVDFYPNFSGEQLRRYYRQAGYGPNEPGMRCLGPWLVAYIFPDGEVRPCLNLSYSFGNIKTEKFAELWNSQRAVDYRQLVKEKKIFPVCIRCTELYRY